MKTMALVPLLAVVVVTACSSAAPTARSGAQTAAGAPGTLAPNGGTDSPVPVENNPPGDIPDNVAFVSYRNTQGGYVFTHPEGWVETTRGSVLICTDKLNGVQIALGSASSAPTVTSARRDDIPMLQSSQAAFELKTVEAVTLPAGSGVRIVYRRNSAPDPVTNRRYRDEVERYELFSGKREVIVELFGAVGSDNVDAYRKMISSLRLA